jgi:Tfp pilus assembly protein PilN
MSSAMTAALRINLLPTGDKTRQRRRLTLPRINVGGIVPAVVACVVVGGVVLVGLQQEHSIRRARSRLADLTAVKQQLAPQVAAVERLRATRAELTRRLHTVESLSAHRRRAADQIAALPYALPERLWLTTATFSDSMKARIEGVALSPLTVADLVARLDSTEVFRKANLVSAEAGKIDETAVTRFVVQCGLVE